MYVIFDAEFTTVQQGELGTVLTLVERSLTGEMLLSMRCRYLLWSCPLRSPKQRRTCAGAHREPQLGQALGALA